MKFELIHDLPRDPDTAWRILTSDEYDAAAGARTKISKTLIHHGEENGTKVRRHRVTSDRKLPGPIAKVMGSDGLSYELIETFDDQSRISTWKVVPSKLSDRVVAEGTYAIEPGKTPDTCLRRIRGEVIVSVALIGKKIEAVIESELKASYETSTEFARDYLSSH